MTIGSALFLCSLKSEITLSASDFSPVYESIKVIYKETEEADDHGKVGRFVKGCKYPEYDQNHIVRSIKQAVICASEQGK